MTTPDKKRDDKRLKTQLDRITECDLVIGYDIENADAFVIKDTEGATGRVSYAHALKRLALAKLRSEVLHEQQDQEGLDEEEEEESS